MKKKYYIVNEHNDIILEFEGDKRTITEIEDLIEELEELEE